MHNMACSLASQVNVDLRVKGEAHRKPCKKKVSQNQRLWKGWPYATTKANSPQGGVKKEHYGVLCWGVDVLPGAQMWKVQPSMQVSMPGAQ